MPAEGGTVGRLTCLAPARLPPAPHPASRLGGAAGRHVGPGCDGRRGRRSSGRRHARGRGGGAQRRRRGGRDRAGQRRCGRRAALSWAGLGRAGQRWRLCAALRGSGLCDVSVQNEGLGALLATLCLPERKKERPTPVARRVVRGRLHARHHRGLCLPACLMRQRHRQPCLDNSTDSSPMQSTSPCRARPTITGSSSAGQLGHVALLPCLPHGWPHSGSRRSFDARGVQTAKEAGRRRRGPAPGQRRGFEKTPTQ